jgi:hypothetical protein
MSEWSSKLKWEKNERVLANGRDEVWRCSACGEGEIENN